jgi:hypothetical protein
MGDIKDPTLSRQPAYRWRVGCQPYAQAPALLPRNAILLRLLITSVRGSVNPRTQCGNHLLGSRTATIRPVALEA